MLPILQTRYQRVEKALDTLLESITAYNPSLTAADELLAADDDTSANLDTQIKTTIRTLADARKTLQSIALPSSSLPTTTQQSSTEHRPVRVNELLSYAKFISKTTVPPTRTPPIQPDTAASTDPQPSQTNGLSAPPIKTEPTSPNPASSAPTPGPAPVDPPTQGATLRRVLPPEVKGDFIPWPSHEIIKNGGLGAVQAMVEQGRDPGEVTLSKEEMDAKEEEERREREKREEEERVRREEEVRRRRGERMEQGQGAGGAGAGQREEDVFDPDEM
ncbi:hypothetical protein KVT40_008898 [Elsinoe batatas]|uniref:Mediator of RNA polymerase II transcription subunit 4 n=1 Tax=Elsinoe batatas TaxID=2601811 RepID=A0A8K0KUU5_9PEZI|nr:hypothetical protein KVT40_008898 [Elsinoe batatas]